VSGSTLAYVEYYTRYLEERELGKKYRESVRCLSKEFRVSETTIKKAIKVVKDA
jgi:predicted transcriptional regulator